MKHIFLDTNVIIEAADLLAYSDPEVRFLVAECVLAELRHGRGSRQDKRSLVTLVDAAIASGAIQLFRPAEGGELGMGDQRLGFGDAELLRTICQYIEADKSRRHEVYLATNDRILQEEAGLLAIKVLGAEQLRAQLTDSGSRDEGMARRASEYSRAGRRYMLVGFFWGALAAYTVYTVVRYFEYIERNVGVLAFIVAGAVGGPLLYLFRGRLRLSYGVMECTVGFIAVYMLHDRTAYDAQFMLQAAGGLYVVVRGLDNMEKGLEGTRWHQRWRHFFYGS